MFLNQMIGTFNLALPIIIAYQFVPDFILSPFGIALCALLVGLYIYYVNYRQVRNLQHVLEYSPRGETKQSFDDEIVKCGLNPDDICLRYSYLNDNVASSTLSTICVDPMVWKGLESDDAVVPVKDVIEQHVLPSVPEQNKKLHEHIRAILTPDAQRFIFRHELGHMYHAYSTKILASFFVVAASATGIGMASSAAIIAQYGGFAAIISGLGIGAFFDTVFSYTNNAFFKVVQERKADEFALQFSSSQEIEAAADFFEKYEVGAQEFRENSFLLSYLPVTAITGHPSAPVQVSYLRSKAKELEISSAS